MMFILKYWRYFLPVVVLLLIGLLVFGYGIKQYNAGYKAAENEYRIERLEGEDARSKLEKEVITLSKPDLVKRYCHWLRDADYSECVQANLPVN